jgi:hypothetical protein
MWSLLRSPASRTASYYGREVGQHLEEIHELVIQGQQHLEQPAGAEQYHLRVDPDRLRSNRRGRKGHEGIVGFDLDATGAQRPAQDPPDEGLHQGILGIQHHQPAVRFEKRPRMDPSEVGGDAPEAIHVPVDGPEEVLVGGAVDDHHGGRLSPGVVHHDVHGVEAQGILLRLHQEGQHRRRALRLPPERVEMIEEMFYELVQVTAEFGTIEAIRQQPCAAAHDASCEFPFDAVDLLVELVTFLAVLLEVVAQLAHQRSLRLFELGDALLAQLPELLLAADGLTVHDGNQNDVPTRRHLERKPGARRQLL